MKNITTRLLLISLSLFMLGIIYTGCEDKNAVNKVTNGPEGPGAGGDGGTITVSGKVDDNGIHVWSNAKDNIVKSIFLCVTM